MKSQKFNVLCVTKRNRQIDSWHEPITGEAEVRVAFTDEMGVQVAKTVILFRGREYDLSYVRKGLNGTAVTIGIKNSSQLPYDTWDLYTDTPAPGPNPCTSEDIRNTARQEIERKHPTIQNFGPDGRFFNI